MLQTQRKGDDTTAEYTVGALPHSQSAGKTVAVFVAHGMGQQIPFQTMDAVATGLRALDPGGAEPPGTQAVKNGAEWLHRIEMPLKRGAVDVHIYEAYWAPLTEGRITLRDVIRFLAGAGRNAIKNAKNGRFDRWLFGSFKSYPIAMRTLFYLLATLAAIGALVAMNSAIAAVAAATALLGRRPEWLTAGLFGDLTTTFNAVMAIMAAAGLALFVGITMSRPIKWLGGRRVYRYARLAWAALTTIVLVAAIFVVVLAGLAIPVLFYAHIRGGIPADGRLWHVVFSATRVDAFDSAAATGLLGLAVLVIGGVALVWLVRIVIGIGRDLFRPKGVVGTVVVAVLFATLVVAAAFLLLALRRAGGISPGAPPAVNTGLVWLLLVAASGYVRQVLVQFLGDVAIYVMPYKLDAFNDLRREIRACSMKVAEGIYALKQGGSHLYDEVIVVGHSLGSVVAYDVLNRLILEDEAAEEGKKNHVVKRTRMLLTFGSPLDKTAFIFALQGSGTSEPREALAASAQPMIRSYDLRPQSWVNVYTPLDIISGHLGFYDDPESSSSRKVKNVIDVEATTPIVSHTEYWSNTLVYEIIYDALSTA